MNDDIAEKANRRKSAHFGDIGRSQLGKEKEGAGKRVVSALAMQAQQHAVEATGAGIGAAGSANVAIPAKDARRIKRLSAIAPAAPPVSMEVMNTNFEEWMKLATDNVSIYSPRVN
jgi:condensin complex subunit 2